MLGDRTITGIAVAVTALWVLLNLYDAYSPLYDTPVAVHGIMGLVAGSAFGEKIRRNRGNGRSLRELGLEEDDDAPDR